MLRSEADPDYLTTLAGEIKVLAKCRHQRAVTPQELDGLINRLPLLSHISAAGGTDLRGQAAAIDAMVVAAVDRLGAKAGTPGQDEVDEEELEQIRFLLGLAPETRRLSWGKHQEAAARARHQALATFRKNPRERLFYLLAMELSEDWEGLIPPRLQVPEELTVFSGQQALHPWLTQYIRAERPSAARLVLNSGVASAHILSALREVEAEITLLVCHPAAAITEWQRERIKTSIKEMRQLEFAGYDKLVVLFYQIPPSLRGWRIGDYVGLSWYTYRDDLAIEVGQAEQIVLSGHDNIVVVGKVSTPLGERLATWFEREADSLVHHRLTISEEQYYRGSSTPLRSNRGAP